MSDGEIDFSRYSVKQLVGALKSIDQQRYPLNYQNAVLRLREKWPDAPHDLRTVSVDSIPDEIIPPQTLPDGARRFAVGFQASERSAPANDQKLAGRGAVEVGPTTVTFIECREDKPYKSRVFLLADVANVEFSVENAVVVVRTRNDKRFVTLWPQSGAETSELVSLLPTLITPEFKRQAEHEMNFERESLALSPRQPVTATLIGINLLIFIVMMFAGAGLMELDTEVHIRFGSNLGPLTWTGEPWRLLTSAFIHFGVIHVAFNMYALWNGGRLTERLYGSARFLTIYLLAAVAGSVVSGWWDPTRNSAGASGAVFGVYGALLVFFALRRNDVPMRLLKSAGQGALLLLGYSLLYGATHKGVDNAAHVGGLLGGALAGLLLARPFNQEARSRPRPRRLGLAVGVVLAALVALSWPLLSPQGSRGAQLQFYRATRDFAPQETRIVGEFKAIFDLAQAEKLSLPEAGGRVEREVIPAWHKVMAPIMALDPLEPGDSVDARRLALLKEYVQARDRAMRMTAETWRGTSALSPAVIDAQWQKVLDTVATLKELK